MDGRCPSDEDRLSPGLYGMRKLTVFFASEVEGGQNADTSD
jgi:hypothetical protein